MFLLAAPLIIDLYTVGSHGPQIATERQVATSLLRLFSPQLLAYGAISLMTAVLNAARRFSAPAFTPIINNLVAIAILLAFAAVGHTHSLSQVEHDHHLLLLLGLGTTLGVVLQAVALIPSLLTCGLQLRLRWRPDDPAVREIVRLSGWTFGFVVGNQAAVFVVSAVAVSIGADDPDCLYVCLHLLPAAFRHRGGLGHDHGRSCARRPALPEATRPASPGNSALGFAARWPASSRPSSVTCCSHGPRSR